MDPRRDVARRDQQPVGVLAFLCCLLPILLAGAACSSAPAAVTEAPVARCAELGELACLDSTECTLRLQEAGGYACTEPESDCELGFVQSKPKEIDCASGCTLVPAHCYCAPDVDCFCGGGPPAMCVAEDAGGDGE